MNYIEKPHLPFARINFAIMQNYNLNIPFSIIPTVCCSELPTPEQFHADLQIIHLGEDLFVCSPTVFDYYNNTLIGARLIMGDKSCNYSYPDNVLYNAAIVGNKMFGKLSCLDRKVLECAKENGLDLVNVKQGYTKCSTAIISENAVITSDHGLAELYRNNNIDVLLISDGNINLPGYNYGFIGGCCTKISNDVLWFTGNISAHPDYTQILNFCKKYGCDLCFDENNPLTDIGSIIPIAYHI